MRIHSNGYWFCSLVQVSIPKFWCWRLHISETIWTTETSFAPFGSATIALGHSENRTRISPTVSEIFDRKNCPERGYFFIIRSNYRSGECRFCKDWNVRNLFFFPTKNASIFSQHLTTYLLLAEMVNPPFFDIKWKILTGNREFLILAG